MISKSWYLTEVGAGGKPSKESNKMLWDGSDKISALKISSKLWSHCSWIFVNNFTFRVKHILSSLVRVFQKLLVSFLYFPPSFPARLITVEDLKSCANVFNQSLQGIFGTLIRGIINSGQQVILFCHNFDGMLGSPVVATWGLLLSLKEPKK